MIGMKTYGNPLSTVTKVTTDRGDLIRIVTPVTSQITDLLRAVHRIHARQVGCVFQDMMSPKSILRKSTDMPNPIQRVKITKAIARRTKNSRPKSFARIYLPRGTSSAQPQRAKI